MFVRALLQFLAYVFALLGVRGLRLVAASLGILAFDLLRLRRKVVLENLDIAFGDSRTHAEKIRIGRLSYINFLDTTLEFFASKRLYSKLQTSTKNAQHMEQALAQGHGVYNMIIHMGNFELMASAGAKYWTRVNAVTKPVGKGEFAAWVRQRREENGHFEILPGGGQGSRQKMIFDALRRKEIVGFMVDQRRSKGIRLPFFSKPALTNTSLFQLWKRQRAPIVPALMHRTGLASHEYLFFPEFVVHENPDWTDEQFLTENSLRMNAVVEDMIRVAPEEYFWLHKRWK